VTFLRRDRRLVTAANFLDCKEMLKAHNLENSQDTRPAADHGEAAIQVAKPLVRTEENGEAGAVEVVGMREIYDDHIDAAVNLAMHAFIKVRCRAHIDIAAGAYDRSFAGPQNF